MRPILFGLIGVLVGCQSVVKNAGGQLRIASVTDRVAKIFRLAGVENVLHVDPNCSAALAHFAANA